MLKQELLSNVKTRLLISLKKIMVLQAYKFNIQENLLMSVLNKNNLLYLIFVLVIMKFFNTFYGTYFTLKWDYNYRMTQSYGYCNNESWGFYNQVAKKYDLKGQEMRIINDGGYVIIHPLFKNIDQTQNKNSTFLMLLNFQSEIDNDIYSSSIENIKNYSIKYKFGNCYFLELND